MKLLNSSLTHLSQPINSHILKLTASSASSDSSLEGVELLMEAIRKSGYEKEVKIGMDVAASEFLLPSG